MRSFWISLLVFVLLMCSCRTKKFGCEVDFTTKETARIKHVKYQALQDTTRTLRLDIDKSKLTIIEHITITKYDKDTGVITEKTETERKIAQDSDKVATEEEIKGLSEVSVDSTYLIIDVNEMVSEEVKEESEGGQDAFGKWFGIVLGCFFVGLFVYLGRKLKILS